MNAKPFIVLLAIALPAMACDKPTGTCISVSGFESCTINASKSFCEAAGDEFFEENTTEGLMRCKSEGFETSLPAVQLEQRLKNKDAVTMSRPVVIPGH